MAQALCNKLTKNTSAATNEPQHAILNVPITVSAPIGKMESRHKVMGILPTTQGGRDALSVITPIAYNPLNYYSLHKIKIETGRTHQIRVHMSDVSKCPLVGDDMYDNQLVRTGRSKGVSKWSKRGVRRCMLHAAEVKVPHPRTGEMVCVTCPPPPEFESLARNIRAASAQP